MLADALEHLVRGLVPNPDDVRVRESDRGRIRTFEVVEMHSRAVGWDARFIYLEQSMWKGGTCCNQIVYRSAVTSREGIVPPARVMEAMGIAPETPDLPAWVQAWIDAEAERPWPPAR